MLLKCNPSMHALKLLKRMHDTRTYCIKFNIDDTGTCTCNLNHCNIYR